MFKTDLYPPSTRSDFDKAQGPKCFYYKLSYVEGNFQSVYVDYLPRKKMSCIRYTLSLPKEVKYPVLGTTVSFPISHLNTNSVLGPILIGSEHL